MKKTVAVITFVKCFCIISAQEKSDAKSREQTSSFSEKSENVAYHYVRPEVPFNQFDGSKVQELNTGGKLPSYPIDVNLQTNRPKYINPLEGALLVSTNLGLISGIPVANAPDLLPINPYLALLLSHYGRYLPHGRVGKGLYGYAAANNYHNNKPFGAYKVYEEP